MFGFDGLGLSTGVYTNWFHTDSRKVCCIGAFTSPGIAFKPATTSCHRVEGSPAKAAAYIALVVGSLGAVFCVVTEVPPTTIT